MIDIALSALEKLSIGLGVWQLAKLPTLSTVLRAVAC